MLHPVAGDLPAQGGENNGTTAPQAQLPASVLGSIPHQHEKLADFSLKQVSRVSGDTQTLVEGN